MKKKIITGIIGYGVVGQLRHSFLEKNKKYSVKYISDLLFKKNHEKKSIYYFKKYIDLLNKKDLNAVFITLPNYLAPIVTKQALKKNLHVFCEKPPAKNVKDLKSVINIEKKFKSLKLKYGFNHRYHGSVMKAKEILNNKQLGKIVNIRAVYGKSKIVTFNKNEWRAQKRFSGGGILLDQGIHLIDLILFFHGNFIKFKSFISNKFWKYDVEDNAFSIMRDKKGVIASIHSTATQWEHKFSIEITCQKGMLILSGILSSTKSYGKEQLIVLNKIKNGIKKKYFTFKNDHSWKNEIEDFAKLINNNDKVRIGSSFQALSAMEVIEKIYKSDN
jgi:predicted dehydrogenase